ncbi:peroxiredoxin [Rhodothalassium salexigens DSM 2132]|uniref:Peroxiredoxin n=1 Tax=Rhodothalassium salexigens DSM 2132 TaxID=1188247 RepID=A0A4R2PPH6_RHOSA|nr:redoxin domain-containing protein [Rhodothalassium salexigens]MBB4210765.1 peroxiredoxin [Rhodothalassium salexigens DSM 2132]MBK1638255.1 thioredoxin family protein [Rhodothalassium salexigens DSM 2132]TCP37679.1 peroxiredoxin [Rhodothalassium salexigens DSM 2132]
MARVWQATRTAVRSAGLGLGVFVCVLLGGASAAVAAEGPQPNAPAPVFEGATADGHMVALDQFRGQPVVLEWTNHLCPYVQKHYGAGNMQALQRRLTDAGAVWLSVISSAPGKQGYVSGKEARALTDARDAAPTHVLLDPDGRIGRAYGATATPHMFLIDAEGILRYMGAIDDQPSADPATVETAENYLAAAWDAVAAGAAPETQVTRAYGCSVKY